MHSPTILASAVAIGCAALAGSFPGSALEPNHEPVQETTAHFDKPDGPLVIPDAASGNLMLSDVLREFRRVTGQNICMADETLQMLSATSVGLIGGVTVPEGEVYSFMESLLHRHRFVMAELRHSDPPLLALYHKGSRDGQGISRFIEVEEAKLPNYADHPALLVQTVIDVSPLDARQVSTSMRTLLTDSNHQKLVAMGGASSLLLAGTGSEVSAWVSMLKKASENQRTLIESQPETKDD